MRKFKSHKVVEAAIITAVVALKDGGARLEFEPDDDPKSIDVDAQWLAKHEPVAGGVYVRYADGYTSFSPMQPFLEGYAGLQDEAPAKPEPQTGPRTPAAPGSKGPIYLHEINPANEKLLIEAVDGAGPGGANHAYTISGFDTSSNASADGYPGRYTVIFFQNGPLGPNDTPNGVTHEALLAILIHRLRGFQAGPYACRENALALTKLEEALMWLQQRTRQRMARGVEGTMQK